MALLFAGLAQAQPVFTYNSGTLNTAIPDGNPVGISSSTNFSGISDNIASIQVNLNITGGFNGDLYVYLAGPSGQFAVLLNRVGVTGVGAGNAFGYSDAGFNVTFDQGGVNIHNYQGGSYTLVGGQLTGAWAPDGRNIDPASAPGLFDSASTGADLGQFVNIDPNGTWTLFLADMSGGGQSTLNSWGLTIVTVPEPQTWAMLAGGAGMLLMLRRRASR